MNKLFNKIATIALGLAMAIGVGTAIGGKGSGVRSVSAETYSASSVSTVFSDTSNYSWGGLTWTLTHSGGSYGSIETSGSARGQQIGSGSSACTSFSMTTNSSISNVTSVKVNASIASSGTAKLSVKVGSTNFISNQSLTTTATEYSGTGTASGAVQISFSNTSKAFYIKAFTITYGGGGGAPTGAATSTSFSTTRQYVLRATYSNTNYYLNGTTNGTLDADASWGTCTTTEASGYKFSLSGSTAASSTTIQATTVISGTTYYLKALSTGKFHLSTSSQNLTLKADGTIYNPTSTSYNLRYNYNSGSGGFRWYTGTTTVSGYFIEASTPSYTVTWKNWDNTTLATDTVEEGSTPSYSGSTPTKASTAQYTYTFTGWSPTPAAINADTTYTAQFSSTVRKYTVSFNMQGHGSAPNDQSVSYGGTVDKPSDPSVTGWTFGGWYKEAACTNAWNFTNDTITGATVIYAKWTQVMLSVDVSEVNYGSISDAPSTVGYGETLDVNLTPSFGYVLPSSITVMMGETELVENTDYTYDDASETNPGEIIITDVTDDITITATCDPRQEEEFNIHYTTILNCTHNGPAKMFESDEVTITITPNSGYKLPEEDAGKVVVTGGAEDWVYTKSTGELYIEHASADVYVSIECVALANNSINNSTLTGVTADNNNPDSVIEGQTVTLTYTANNGYALPTSSGVTVTGAASSTWTQANGTLQITGGTSNITISIIGVEIVVTGITLSSSSGTYELGDAFIMPTVTASYNVGPSADVTSQSTATGGGLVNGILTEKGTKTITITYGSFSKTYTATVNKVTPSDAKYVKVTSAPTDWSGKYLIVYETTSKIMDGSATSGSGAQQSVTIDDEDNSILSTTTIDGYSFTIAKGTTDTSKYTVQSASGYYMDRPTSGSGGSLSWSSDNAYEISIAYVTDHTEIRASSYVSSSAEQILQYNSGSSIFKFYKNTQSDVQLYKYQPAEEKVLKWITAVPKSNSYYQGDTLDANDFTVTAHYNDETTSTISSNITVTNGYLANIGNNTVTLTYSQKSCDVVVNAIEQTAEYTGLSWDQGEYTIINGQSISFSQFGTVTAEYDDGDSYVEKSIASCSVAIYTKNGNVYSKVDDLSDGDTIASASHGKYLGVTYTDTNTFTAYSSDPIYVVESLNPVYEKREVYNWSKVTTINDGDVVTFVGESKSKIASGTGNNIITATEYNTTPTTDFYFTVGEVKVGNNTYYTFHNTNGYLGCHNSGTSGNNYAYLDSEIDTSDNKNYFTVSFDEDDNVIITSVFNSSRKLQLRSDSPYDRFCFYGNAQIAMQLYKGSTGYEPYGDNIANTDAIAQKVVLEYAEHFNDVMNCIEGGTTTNVSGKWSDLADDFTDWFKNGDKDLNEDQVENALALFAGADAKEAKIGGDTLQDMLARYEYICAKYELDDFLHDEADRPPVPQRGHFSPFLSILTKNPDVAAIVIIVSVISVAAVGGYFFLRKKKEQ